MKESTGSDHLSVEAVYDFILATSDKNGRRRASPMLVYADMVTSGLTERYEGDEWPIVGQYVAILAAHNLIRIEHGPETELYGGTPKSMIQVTDWNMVRPKRSSIPMSVRRSVYQRDGHRCVECQSTSELTLDHILAWSRGGSDDMDNLQTMCRKCNASKGNR